MSDKDTNEDHAACKGCENCETNAEDDKAISDFREEILMLAAKRGLRVKLVCYGLVEAVVTMIAAHEGEELSEFSVAKASDAIIGGSYGVVNMAINYEANCMCAAKTTLTDELNRANNRLLN